MFPQHPFAVLPFSKTRSPDPSAPRTLSSRLNLGPSTGHMRGAQSLWEVGQGEGQYSLQNVLDAQHCAMEEESNSRNASVTPAFSPALFSDIGLDDHLEQKHPSGRQFPFKLYEMLEDQEMAPYVRWIKSGHRDAFLIPNIEAFTGNVMPKHFKEMNQWASFQKQLNNYGFEKQDRGPGKASYAHSENKLRKGRPDLLHEILRRPNWSTKAFRRQTLRSSQRSPSSLASPPAPQSGSQVHTSFDEVGFEPGKKELQMMVLELRKELEDSKVAQSMMKNQLQLAENRLLVTETRVLALECQLHELLGQKHMGGSTLMSSSTAVPIHGLAFNTFDCFGDTLAPFSPVPRQRVSLKRSPEDLASSVFHHAPGAGGEGCGTHLTAPLQGVTSGSCLPTEMAHNSFVPMFGSIFSAPSDASLGAQPSFL